MPIKKILAVLITALLTLTLGVVGSQQAAAAETVIRVTDFGADPYGVDDSAEGVQAAIEHAKTVTGPVRIVFPKGTYHFYPDRAQERELYVTNTVGADLNYRMKRIAILLEDMDDVTVDGGGSQFVMHGQQVIFATLRSANTSISNFDLEWVSPRVVDLTVIDEGAGYRDVRIPDGYRYTVNGRTLGVTSELSPYTGQPYWSYSSLAGLYTQKIELDSGWSYRGGNPFAGVTSITEVEPGVLRFTGSTVPVGHVFQIRTTTRDTPGMFAFESTNTTIEDIRLGYLHGFGIVSQMSDTLTVRDVDFRAAADSWRHSSAFADLIQVSGDKGEVLIEGNAFGFAHDDPINVHGTYVQYVSGSGSTATFEYRHNETAGFPQFYPGDQVGLVDRTTMLEVSDWTATVVSVDGPSGYDQDHPLTRMTVTFDKPLPSFVDSSRYVAENLTYSPDLTVRGNHFETIPTRGLLASTRGTVVVEDNVFDQQNMASIFVSGDANSWYESSAVRDMTIRNNVFIRPSSDHPVLLFQPITQTALSDTKVHSGIVIDSNVFMVGDTPVLDAKSVDGLTFTNNEVRRYDGGLRPTLTASAETVAVGGTVATTLSGATPHSDPLVILRNSLNVTLGGNTYDDGLNRRLSLVDGTAASAVTLGGDALSVNANNTANQGAVGYESSNPEVATVDAEGRVTGVSEGTAEITAWRQSPVGFAESAPVTITVTAGVPVETPWELSSDVDVVRPGAGTSRITESGELELLPAGQGLWDTQLGQDIYALNTPTVGVGESVTVQMAGVTKAWYEEAGLMLYTNDDNYVAIQRKHGGGNPGLFVVTEENRSPNESRRVGAPTADPIWLRLTRVDATTIQGSWSADGVTFTDVGTPVVNASITDASRVAFMASGSNLAAADMPRFTFSDLAVGDTEVPFAVRGSATGTPSPAKPDAVSRVAQLAGATFTGVELPGTTAGELASRFGYVTLIPEGVDSYTAAFTPVEPGATVAARLDGQPISAVDGVFTVDVTGGANVLEVWVTAPDGTQQRIYRWVTLSLKDPAPYGTPPAIAAVEDQQIDVDVAYSQQLTMVDGGLEVTWSATGLPAGLMIDGATGLISGTPTVEGRYTVRVAAATSDGYEAIEGFELIVGKVPRFVDAAAPASIVLSGDGTVTFATADIPELTKLVVSVPDGWQVSPSQQWLPVGDGTATVTVRAPQEGTSGVITATLITADGRTDTITRTIALDDPASALEASVIAWDSSEPEEGAPNGYPAAAVDGDPTSFWHTQWDGASPDHPHYLVIDLGEEKTISSLTYVPRAKSACGSSIFPTACNGQIAGYEISAATGGSWVAPTAAQLLERAYLEPADATYFVVATGTFDSSNTSPKTVEFDQPVTTRYLKLTSTGAVGGQAWAHIAELIVSAGAAEPPADLADEPLEAAIIVDPTTVAAGEPVSVTGGGFAAGEDVTVTAGSATATVAADANGFISTELTIPAAQPSGVVTVTATQGELSATARVTVEGAPPVDGDDPVIGAIAAISGTVGEAIDPVTVSAEDESEITFALSGVPGLVIDPATGVISGTPTEVGTFTGTVTVTDSEGNSATRTFTVTVAAAPVVDETDPVIGAIAAISGTVGEAISPVIVTAEDESDVTFALSGVPGLSINTDTGVISGTPTEVGTFTGTVTVTDSEGNSATKTFTVTVAAAPVDPVEDTTAPVVTAVPSQAGKVGTPVRVQVSASDESLPLTYSATGLPAGVTIDPTTGLISGTPSRAGVSTVTVTVTDAEGNAATVAFRLSIAPNTYPRSAPYTLAGEHTVNGRQWRTTCEPYSQTERCRAEIWASVVKRTGNVYTIERGWAFNNLTYLPFMKREQWASNPLGGFGRYNYSGEFVGTDGQKWRVECDTVTSGRNGCRAYRMTTVYNATPRVGGGYTFGQSNEWVFNNIVLFGNYSR